MVTYQFECAAGVRYADDYFSKVKQYLADVGKAVADEAVLTLSGPSGQMFMLLRVKLKLPLTQAEMDHIGQHFLVTVWGIISNERGQYHPYEGVEYEPPSEEYDVAL